MLSRRDHEAVELECPECSTVFKTSAEAVEKGRVRCPRGHEFDVMGMLGDPAPTKGGS